MDVKKQSILDNVTSVIWNECFDTCNCYLEYWLTSEVLGSDFIPLLTTILIPQHNTSHVCLNTILSSKRKITLYESDIYLLGIL